MSLTEKTKEEMRKRFKSLNPLIRTVLREEGLDIPKETIPSAEDLKPGVHPAYERNESLKLVLEEICIRYGLNGHELSKARSYLGMALGI